MAPPGLGPATVVASLLGSLSLVSSSIRFENALAGSPSLRVTTISYMLESFNLYQLFLNSGPLHVMRELLHAHAPLQDMLGIAGYWLFGVADRSVYLMNGVLAVGFTGVVL